MMGTRVPDVPITVEDLAAPPIGEPVEDEADSPLDTVAAAQSAAPEDVEVAESDLPPAPAAAEQRPDVPAAPAWASRLLRQLRAAPIRVRCVGACDVRYGDDSLNLGDPELLLLLAVHPSLA